jgi:hypothetical protein
VGLFEEPSLLPPRHRLRDPVGGDPDPRARGGDLRSCGAELGLHRRATRQAVTRPGDRPRAAPDVADRRLWR